MASSFNSQYNFCLFCYKTIDTSLETTDKSKVIKKFINLINSYVKNTNTYSLNFPGVLLKKLSGVDNLLNLCYGCQDKLEGFCEKYQQLKILEMELDWKLGQLTEEINYANILPTRWMHVDKVLEEASQNDLERKCGSHNLIKKLRQFVVDAGNQKRKQSRPRVLLKRNTKLDEEAKIKEKSLSEDVDSTNIKTEDKMIEDLLIQIKAEPPDDTSDDIENGRGLQPLENIGQDGYENENGNIEFRCPNCEKIYKRRFDLRIHLEAHKNPNEWKYKCTVCNKKFSAQRYLKYHMEIHQTRKRLHCPYCPTQFDMKRNLRRHINKTHSNRKNFNKIDIQSRKVHPIAKGQDKGIQRSENTIKEELVESENPQENNLLTSGSSATASFECEICRRKLTSLLVKERHFGKNHDLNGDLKRKIFKCRALGCTAYFLKYCQLRYHLRLEHGEKTDQPVKSRKYTKRFGCPVCWRFYSNRSQFQLHMESHKVKENETKQVKTSDETKMVEVKEEECSSDEVECDEIEISENELEEKDGNERDNDNVNKMVGNEENILGDDNDEAIVNVEDIY